MSDVIPAKCLTCGSTSAQLACPKLFAGAEPPLLTEAVAAIGRADYHLACIAVAGCYWTGIEAEAVMVEWTAGDVND